MKAWLPSLDHNNFRWIVSLVVSFSTGYCFHLVIKIIFIVSNKMLSYKTSNMKLLFWKTLSKVFKSNKWHYSKVELEKELSHGIYVFIRRAQMNLARKFVGFFLFIIKCISFKRLVNDKLQMPSKKVSFWEYRFRE